MPDQKVLKLSDMYTVKDFQSSLELEAVILNISGKHNRKLKETCKTLGEYAVYTDKIRKYTEEMNLPDAVDLAIQERIADGVLTDFLKKHRSEVKEMSIFEYDQEKHMRQERKAAWEDSHLIGTKESKIQGKELTLQTIIRKKLEKGKSPFAIANELEETAEHVRELIKEMKNTSLSQSIP